MNIQVVGERNQGIAQLTLDLDQLIEDAEGTGGSNVFFVAATLMAREVESECAGYELWEAERDNMEVFLARYAATGTIGAPLVVRAKLVTKEVRRVKVKSAIFGELDVYPSKDAKARYERLVGLDGLKEQIQKETALLLDPNLLKQWSRSKHGDILQALDLLYDRYPFFVFEGDVGTGKTAFAETFGDAVARKNDKKVLLARVGMKSRGEGHVGELSRNIGQIFSEATAIARSHKCPVILLLDEADSMAQSREESQMHHEDRAGVNALIQGIDQIRNQEFPVLVVFCTNRLGSIDPALKRRASFIQRFDRPNEAQRLEVFSKYLGDVLSNAELWQLVDATGPNKERTYGFTYSDITTRLLPLSLLTAYPKDALTLSVVQRVLREMQPTAPFQS